MKRFCVFTVLLFALLFSGCSQKNVVFNNSMLNLENGTDFIKIEDTTYLSKTNDNNEFVIVKKENQGEKELLKTEHFALSLNYYNGTLFFLDGQKICSYELNDKKLKLLAETHDDSIKSILFKDNFLYYIDGMDLIKLDVDNETKDVIANDALLSFDVLGDMVYYQSATNRGVGIIRRINMADNNQNDILYEGAATYISAQSDGVYFLNYNIVLPFAKGDGKIYKITDDGTATLVCDKSVTAYNINEEMIYYLNREDENKLYSMKKCGTDSKPVFEQECLNVVIYGNEAYCHTRNNMYQDIYKINLKTFEYTLID